MRRQHGRECVHQLNVAVLTPFCVAANASATVTTTCRLSLSCLTLLMMISSTASRSTPVTYYSHICPTNSIYLTNSDPAHTKKLLSIKQNCSIVSLPAPYAALEFARLARVRSISGWATRWVRTLLLLPSWALGTETRR